MTRKKFKRILDGFKARPSAWEQVIKPLGHAAWFPDIWSKTLWQKDI